MYCQTMIFYEIQALPVMGVRSSKISHLACHSQVRLRSAHCTGTRVQFHGEW